MTNPPPPSAMSNALKFVIGHVLAGVVVISGSLLLAVGLYVYGVATAPDGIDTPMAVIPEFLFWMLIAGAGAVGGSTLCFLITCLFQWLSMKLRLPRWLPPLLVSPVAFVVAAAIWWPGERLAVFWVGLGFSLGFAAYWAVVASSSAAIEFLRRRWAHRSVETVGGKIF